MSTETTINPASLTTQAAVWDLIAEFENARTDYAETVSDLEDRVYELLAQQDVELPEDLSAAVSELRVIASELPAA